MIYTMLDAGPALLAIALILGIMAWIVSGGSGPRDRKDEEYTEVGLVLVIMELGGGRERKTIWKKRLSDDGRGEWMARTSFGIQHHEFDALSNKIQDAVEYATKTVDQGTN